MIRIKLADFQNTKTPNLISGFIVFWLLMLSTRVLFPSYSEIISSLNQRFEIIIHFILLALTLVIYKHFNSDDRKIFKWFIITNIFFTLNDMVFYIALYLQTNASSVMSATLPSVKVFINNLVFSIWLISLIIFFSKILIRDIISVKLFVKIILAMFVFNLIVVALFLSPVNFKINILSWQHNLFLIISFIVELIIFDLGMLCLIYSKSKPVSFVVSGFIILIAGDFLFTFGRLAKVEKYYSYGGLMWCLGMIFMLWGLIAIINGKRYTIRDWFRSNGSIKSRVTFWSFAISSGSFLFFFTIASFCSIINKEAFIALPLMLMLYSIFVVTLSVYMGKVIEVLFKKIENNINTVVMNKGTIDNNFSIDEFIFLQKFIFDAFKMKEDQNLLRKKFGDMAAEVAHDVASPLNAMAIVVSNLKKSNVARGEIAILESSVQHIKDVTSTFLMRYRNFDEISTLSTTDEISSTDQNIHYDDGRTPRYVILSTVIEQVVSQKRLEWSQNPCEFNTKFIRKSVDQWAYISPQKFSRCISNLLNNAYESLDKPTRAVTLILSISRDNFKIIIKDNGVGIKAENISEAIAGKSSKHPGNGIGLSGAYKYFASIGGLLSIETVYTEGTSISIQLPVSRPPEWFSNQIRYNYESIFVILDDDPSITILWQRILMKYNVNCKYFFSYAELKEWHSQHTNANIILLIDYDLKDNVNGVDIIQELNIADTYMFTSHADENWLQNLAIKFNFKLIPKYLMESIQIIRT